MKRDGLRRSERQRKGDGRSAVAEVEPVVVAVELPRENEHGPAAPLAHRVHADERVGRFVEPQIRHGGRLDGHQVASREAIPQLQSEPPG